MNTNPIIVVGGEPNSIFFEIFFKSVQKLKNKNPIILIASRNILEKQMKKLKYNFKINLINQNDLKKLKNITNQINLIDIKYSQKNAFQKITAKSENYIHKSFEIAFEIIKKGVSTKLINGPISKKYFLKKKYLGVTEFIAKKFKAKNTAMLIFNKDLAVCPLTTHVPIKSVANSINKKKLKQKIFLINEFYKKNFKIEPKIAVTGLNPHCESIHKQNEDETILVPTIKFLKNKYNVSGPYSADTIFIKESRQKFNVIIGMYHDQVLAPMKTLFEYNAINITLGLPFIRISPDHGPNEKMMGKNISNPSSLIQALKFLDKN